MSYLKYRAEKDPARGMFTRMYGAEWTETYIHDFLFDLEQKMDVGLYQVGKKLDCETPLNFLPTKVSTAGVSGSVATGAAATQTVYFANKKPWDM
mmetsp:Transcript_3348/g.5383  ORF Transcript_3348/g.5383 Transcript_3348/m.5383 type:complete len:95 (+) Transcript_3348:356-640(+)